MGILDSIFKAANATKELTKVWVGGQTADNILDATPVLDEQRDLQASTSNHLIAGLAEHNQRILYGVSPLAIPFELPQVFAGLSDQEPFLCGWIAQKRIGLLRSATLIGISAQYNSTLVAGTILIRPRINGINTALQAQISSAGDPEFTRIYQLVEQSDPLDVVDAAAFDQIDIRVDADAINPNSQRLNGFLWFNVGEIESL